MSSRRLWRWWRCWGNSWLQIYFRNGYFLCNLFIGCSIRWIYHTFTTCGLSFIWFFHPRCWYFWRSDLFRLRRWRRGRNIVKSDLSLLTPPHASLRLLSIKGHLFYPFLFIVLINIQLTLQTSSIAFSLNTIQNQIKPKQCPNKIKTKLLRNNS